MSLIRLCLLLPLYFWLQIVLLSQTALAGPDQYILFNINQHSRTNVFAEIKHDFPQPVDANVRVGLGEIFSYLDQPRVQTLQELKAFLSASQQNQIPIVVQLDGENWWQDRPDLWNWWDKAHPGYSPSNRNNVEWTGWLPDDAIKIAWRNWGSQIRILPPPNLMSSPYRKACHDEMRILIPVILDWWKSLPANQKYLFVGIKLGWESSIGANAWYYPNGNALLNEPVSNDPTGEIDFANPPARGVVQIGYAAVKTAGIRTSGQITEADLAEVVLRHLDDLCKLASQLGVPREKLFTHVAGWKESELLYQAGLNQYSCPGWSFYRHADDPKNDPGVQLALKHTNAPYWAAVEWLYQGPRQTKPWQHALSATLGSSRCRYVCIYNWGDVRRSPDVLQAVREIVKQTSQ
jgi:hypothetical protein